MLLAQKYPFHLGKSTLFLYFLLSKCPFLCPWFESHLNENIRFSYFLKHSMRKINDFLQGNYDFSICVELNTRKHKVSHFFFAFSRFSHFSHLLAQDAGAGVSKGWVDPGRLRGERQDPEPEGAKNAKNAKNAKKNKNT